MCHPCIINVCHFAFIPIRLQEPYGCHDELLRKRSGRDPFAVGPPHFSRCPQLRQLLVHCADYIFEGPLPWDEGITEDDVMPAFS